MSWYALQTRAQHEKVAHHRLVALGYKSLLPIMQRVSRWHDRRKIIDEPVFKGYCFAQFDMMNRLPVLQTPGIVRVVSVGARPEPLPVEDVKNLMGLVASGSVLMPHPFLTQGQRVRVCDGPFTGLTGVFVRRLGTCRLVLTVSLIGQSVSVEIDPSQVEAI